MKFSGYVLPWRRPELSECSCFICTHKQCLKDLFVICGVMSTTKQTHELLKTRLFLYPEYEPGLMKNSSKKKKKKKKNRHKKKKKKNKKKLLLLANP